MVLVAEGVTRLNVLEAYEGNNVTSLRTVEFDTVISTHFNDAPNTFGFTSECVKNGRAFCEFARVDTGESKGAVLIIHDLECKRAQWAVWGNGGKNTSLITFWVNFGLCWNLVGEGR